MRKLQRQLFAVTTMLVMLLSIVLPYQVRAAETTPITVAQAIANNSGTAAVTGYVVGYTTSGSSGKATYDLVAPFKDDFNLAIADSPNETDPTKILPVQLTSGYRAAFGLFTNPTHVGKKIIVTGTLEAYFTVPGLKSPTAISFVDGNTTPPPNPDPTPVTPGEKIREIQGESHTSPFKDKNVTNVVGVVTQVVDASNFYMQDPNPDTNANTSEGILVFKSNHGMKAGDSVAVSGLVKEWVLNGFSDKLQTDLPVTEINAQTGSITKVSSGNPLPTPVVIGKDVIPPTQVIDNDVFATFDPAEDGIDFYESLEGMRVALENPMVTGPQSNAEIPVIIGKDSNKAYTKEGIPLLSKQSSNPERMFLLLTNNNRNFVTKAGDSFNGQVTGVVSYGYSNFKILVNENELPTLNTPPVTSEVTTIEKADDKLTVASYNIENFAASDTVKRDKLAKSIVNNLKSPDIIGVVEMLDDSGETSNGVVNADGNFKALSDAVAGFGGPTYAWTEIAPVDGQDGGVPGGNIRVGYLYNPARVTLNTAPKGNATTAVAYENGSLTLNPGRIDPTNSAFRSSRKPLAAEFTFQGEEVIVIANHFNSKGGDQPLFGKNQPPVLGSEAQRVEIARIINNFVSDIQTKNEDANVVVLGDLNDFEFSNPLTTLKGDDLTNLVETLPASERYTYNYQGNAQVLDHMLVSNRLADKAVFDIVNFNSPYMEVHGRASDHDALVAQLDLVKDPFTLSILHTNDTHAYVEQFPKLITAVNELRAQKKNSLLLHAGDVFSGTLYFRQYLGLADLFFMNQLKYDAMTFGNHEFDKDSQTLANFIKDAKFPIVSANVNISADPVLGPLFKDEVGGSNEQGEVFPAIVKEVNGEEVGIFGLTTEDTVFLANPSDDVKFENAAEKAKETIAMLEAQGVNKIIALSHLGFEPDKELAATVDGIDVIVGGHSHTKLDTPLVVEKEEPTLIVQANEYLKFLGVLDVTFDDNGVIVEQNGVLKDLAPVTQDATALAKVAELKIPLTELQKQIVGNTKVALNGERADVRSKETNLGNLIADGMVAKANESLPTYIAMQNGGGIRASINEGDVTLGEVLTVLPFGNNLVTIDLTGAEIKAALEVSVTTPGAGAFMQVSGLKFKYDSAKPAGNRVWSIEAKTSNGFEQLQLNKTYRVATNAFTADGGDGYTMFKKAKDEGRMTELFVVDFEVFTSYLEKNNPVSPAVEGRIVQQVQDNTAPDAPVVNAVTELSTSVTGQTEAGAKVTVSSKGTILATTVANTDGSFVVAIPKQKVGTELEVTATDAVGNVSAPTKVVVKDGTPPAAPWVRAVKQNDQLVAGIAEAASTVTVSLNGTVIGSSVAKSNGAFVVEVPRLLKDQVIIVTATDAAGNVSKETKVTVGKR